MYINQYLESVRLNLRIIYVNVTFNRLKKKSAREDKYNR